MAPFALLPFKLSATLFALVLVGSIPCACLARLVGVRDRRCYGIALVSAPVGENRRSNVDAISPILLLGLALVWRFRDRVAPAGAALAALVVLKLFLWPLLLWFAFTRRLKTMALESHRRADRRRASLLSWAVIGFDGLHAYPDVLRILTRLLEGKGYSLIALGLLARCRADTAVARSCRGSSAVLLALAVIALRGRRAGADMPRTFAAGHGRSVRALTPIAWLHYFVLLSHPDRDRPPDISRGSGAVCRSCSRDPRRSEHPARDLAQDVTGRGSG